MFLFVLIRCIIYSLLQIGLSFLETSAKEAGKEGKVEEAFMTIAAQIKERMGTQTNTKNNTDSVKISGGQSIGGDSKGCGC